MKTNAAVFTLLIISLFTLLQFCNKPATSVNDLKDDVVKEIETLQSFIKNIFQPTAKNNYGKLFRVQIYKARNN